MPVQEILRAARTTSRFSFALGLSLEISGSLSACVETGTFTTAVPAEEYRAAEQRQVAGVKAAAPVAPAAAAPACDVWLTLKTWDGAVYSDALCIKEPGKLIAIPARIALSSKKKVRLDRYCEAKGTDEKDKQLCIWNRQYYDKYPFSFVLASGDAQPLSTHLSLVRVIRNGKVVYSWNVQQLQDKAQALEVSSHDIVRPDYFKQPVDLGLYVLPSGAEAAQAAVAANYDAAKKNLLNVLGKAASNAASAVVPDAVKSDYACMVQRVLRDYADVPIYHGMTIAGWHVAVALVSGAPGATADVIERPWEGKCSTQVHVVHLAPTAAKRRPA